MRAWATKNVDDNSINLHSVTEHKFLAEIDAKHWNKNYAGKVHGMSGHVAPRKKAVPVEITEVTENTEDDCE